MRRGVNTVAFHPDGTCIASGSADQTVKLWDIRTNKLLQHYPAHMDAVSNIAFHPSGNYLASSSDDTSLKIWDLREGHLFYTLNGHEGATTCVAFSPQGDYFASGATDDQVMVWKTNFDEADKEADAPPQAAPAGKGSKPMIRDKTNHQGVQVEKKAAPKQQTQVIPAAAPLPPAPVAQELPPASQEMCEPEPMMPELATGGTEELPERLAATLDHIIGQLDIITRTVSIMEQRLSTSEDRLQEVEQTQTKILESLDLGV